MGSTERHQRTHVHACDISDTILDLTGNMITPAAVTKKMAAAIPRDVFRDAVVEANLALDGLTGCFKRGTNRLDLADRPQHTGLTNTLEPLLAERRLHGRHIVRLHNTTSRDLQNRHNSLHTVLLKGESYNDTPAPRAGPSR